MKERNEKIGNGENRKDNENKKKKISEKGGRMVC